MREAIDPDEHGTTARVDPEPSAAGPGGRIEVADQAIAKIVRAAVLSSYGIVDLAPRTLRSAIGKRFGLGGESRGIAVQVVDGRVAVELSVVMEYGTPIFTVARNVMKTVKFQLERTLGLPVERVNVNVEGLRVSAVAPDQRPNAGPRVRANRTAAAATAAAPRSEASGPSRTPAAAQIWDGHALLAAFSAATEWLSASKDRVNALNVFPVPDGDTGTNMTLTMQAALAEVRAVPSADHAGAGEVAAKVAYGALMGARGNSGVILSQIFRGFAQGIAGREEIDGRDLAYALAGAREMAYKAVMRPVEGTMLTVIRAAAEAAEQVAARTPTLATVLAAAHHAAAEALADTPNLLEILRQAGVVDAGGQGVVLILDGMERYGRGEPIAATLPDSAGGLGAEMAFLDRVTDLHGDDAFGYCTNFMVFGDEIDFEVARAALAAMGESAVIVGDDRVIKVHIHTLNPGKVLDYAVGWGELGQIKIDNMSAQTRSLTDERAATKGKTDAPAPPLSTPAPRPIGRQSVLTVAPGEGLADALRSMGAAAVVRGGQTDNPSTQELLAAIEAAGAAEVILLPNNPNILLAANQVPSLTAKTVRVVPSRTIPQGLAALEAFNADATIEENARRMEQALTAVRTVELTRAVRDATVNGVAVAAGQVIALLDDTLVAAGDDEPGVLRAALAGAAAETAEIVTIFVGEDADPDQAAQLEAVFAELCPAAEVQVLPGGQPHYRFVIGIQ